MIFFSSDNSTIIRPSNVFDQELHGYILSKLPSLQVHKYFSPFHIGAMLYRHRDFNLLGRKVSTSTIISHLIMYRFFPCKQTTLYKICKLYSFSELPLYLSWTEMQQRGPKPYLSSQGLQELIDFIRTRTEGGYAMSFSEIKEHVTNKIKYEWTVKKKLHLLPTIPENTLNLYASVVKAQGVFNVHNSISNKTESRVCAEWSLRSTISYTMAVIVTHFIPDVTPSPFHPIRKELPREGQELLSLVEETYNDMIGQPHKKVKMIPVLPNLVTSTDEVTLFATPNIVHGKESFYVTAKPSYVKNEYSDSGSRNHYKKDITGDSHCRGVRIVINSTFTAGGLAAPLFVVVYGLTGEELPGHEMVTIDVPGLTVGADQDVYSNGVGYVTFVRGKHHQENLQDNMENNINQSDAHEESVDNVQSKEARIAYLYRTKVYYPFITHIRKTQYGYEGGVVPDNLKAVCWMDGANGQLKDIVREENLLEDEEMKIDSCKHSAARTGVEQAADTGPMFKIMKKIVKEMEHPHASSNKILYHLEKQLDKLLQPAPTDPKLVLRLSAHKRKAITSTLPKLPRATGRSHSLHNVTKGFVLNGQIDGEKKLLPCLSNMLHTYRGDVKGTCLEDKSKLIKDFYPEMFSNGIISEKVFDSLNIPTDRKLDGSVEDRSMSISRENRQRAKILSSKNQIIARRKLVHEKRMAEYNKQLKLYQNENDLYEMNKKCEEKLLRMMKMHMTKQHNVKASKPSTNHETLTFDDVCEGLTYAIVEGNKSQIRSEEAKSFVRVRSKVNMQRGRLAYHGVPTLKDEVLRRLVDLKESMVYKRLFPNPPEAPGLDISDLVVEDSSMDIDEDDRLSH